MIPIIMESYIFKCNLIEILTKTDKILPSYNYIDGATEKNIKKYKKHPIMRELKDDMKAFGNEICEKLKKLDFIQNARLENSPYSGLSIYLHIKFKKPKNDKYLEEYKNSYEIDVRLSDHVDDVGGTEMYSVDTAYKTFDEFYNDLVSVLKEHKEWLDSEYLQYLETHTVSDAQREFSRIQRMKKYYANNRGNRKKK